MASSPKFISILFLLAFFSIQIHAREFFNKVSNNDNTVPSTQQPNSFTPEAQRQEQEPSFYAQTESGYGLYGRDQADELPTESTTTSKGAYKPYVTPVKYHPNEPYNAIPSNNNNAYRNNEKQQNFEEARFADRSTYHSNNNENQITERQGMSDTRFLEKGKYFFDINSERNSERYPDSFGNSRARDVVHYNNGGAGGGYYGNGRQGRNTYQNEEEFEQEEFDQP